MVEMNTFVWNNRAIQHLRQGNSSDAVLILLKAVFRLRKARAREGVPKGFQSKEGQAVLSQLAANISLEVFPKPQTPTEAAFPLFDQAFVFSNSAHTTDDAHLWPLTYGILLYNTGLALHVKGMENGGQPQSLHLAMKFYRMALEVLEAPVGGSLLLLLALFNNMGHIQCHFYNVEEALQCVDWLKALISAKSTVLRPREHSFFSLSVLTGSKLTLAPAA